MKNILNLDTVKTILETARLAPSVHNTQPWKVSFHDDTITVSTDKQHVLTDGDPTGRQTAISIGIFTESIIKCAAAENLSPQTITWDGTVAAITFTENSTGDSEVSTIRTRTTDRSIYTPVEISSDLISSIDTSAIEGTSVWVTTDRESIDKVADLTSRGIRIALGSPNFRNELSSCLTLPWSSSKRGFAVKSLRIPLMLAVVEPLSLRLGIALDKEARLEKRRWLSASGIVYITSEGDMTQDWFNAGRTYMRVALLIEDAGMAQATSAATVETSNFHEDVETILGTKQRLQSVIRIGNGAKEKVYSPRISVDEILTSN